MLKLANKPTRNDVVQHLRAGRGRRSGAESQRRPQAGREETLCWCGKLCWFISPDRGTVNSELNSSVMTQVLQRVAAVMKYLTNPLVEWVPCVAHMLNSVGVNGVQ